MSPGRRGAAGGSHNYMSEREQIEFDVLVVGAGPAGLAAAIRLKQLSPETQICVIEKGSQVGAHILSGAVIEPEPLDELLPGWRDEPPPVCVPASRDEFVFLTASGRFRLPTPPQMHNKGNFIVSLGATCAWLAEKAEALEIEVFPGFAASEPLFDDAGERVIGVRIGDLAERVPSCGRDADLAALEPADEPRHGLLEDLLLTEEEAEVEAHDGLVVRDHVERVEARRPEPVTGQP